MIIIPSFIELYIPVLVRVFGENCLDQPKKNRNPNKYEIGVFYLAPLATSLRNSH